MRRLVLLLALLAPAAPAGAQAAPEPHVVAALVDTGINPYHAAFRDSSPLAYQHPSTYLPGYPADAEALHISLDAPSYEAAFEADFEVIWRRIENRKLYWIPGTRIVGAITMGGGQLIDNHGHGTMTSSRTAGSLHSLAPAARIVMVQGTSAAGVRWAADAGWIDVQSNSWGSLLPGPLPPATSAAFAYAASRHLVFAASGNGTGFIAGVAPNPTIAAATAAPGVITVGAHDNGRMTPWSGSPPLVVADGYGGYRAHHQSITEFGPSPYACCTSAASPYAAGGGAAVILEARRILGDTRTGVREGVVAEGPAQPRGPLEDGKLTLDELHFLLLHTAEALPTERPDDGLLHWLGAGREPEHVEWGPGANPYCAGCYTLPVSWSSVPGGPPWYAQIGYGAISDLSVASAARVLSGQAEMPARDAEDAFFAADAAVRDAVFTLP